MPFYISNKLHSYPCDVRNLSVIHQEQVLDAHSDTLKKDIRLYFDLPIWLNGFGTKIHKNIHNIRFSDYRVLKLADVRKIADIYISCFGYSPQQCESTNIKSYRLIKNPSYSYLHSKSKDDDDRDFRMQIPWVVYEICWIRISCTFLGDLHLQTSLTSQ